MGYIMCFLFGNCMNALWISSLISSRYNQANMISQQKQIKAHISGSEPGRNIKNRSPSSELRKTLCADYITTLNTVPGSTVIYNAK